MVEQWTENPCVSGSIPLLDKHQNLFFYMNINIIKLLLKLKNASIAQKEAVTIKYNQMCLNILKVLYKEGFIQSFTLSGTSIDKKIHVVLRYSFNKPTLSNLRIISTSSKLKYLTYSDLCKLPDKRLVLWLSTSNGFLTGYECKEHQLGGKLLFIC